MTATYRIIQQRKIIVTLYCCLHHEHTHGGLQATQYLKQKSAGTVKWTNWRIMVLLPGIDENVCCIDIILGMT